MQLTTCIWKKIQQTIGVVFLRDQSDISRSGIRLLDAIRIDEESGEAE